MADRREALKIIGAIGSTCAFPFASDELYGQHVHEAGKPAVMPAPKYFRAADLATVSRIADLIIPATDTPGAVGAGVPAYIDLLVSESEAHQKVFQAGLAWIDAQSKNAHQKPFVQLSEEQQIALLMPLSEAVDAGNVGSPAEKFFRAMKSMTADGYYTSKTGLVDELGYKGNTVMAAFPACEIPEH
jgi:gluconate 2-dehydrogenase gamma chain